jgi:hypothetical protein
MMVKKLNVIFLGLILCSLVCGYHLFRGTCIAYICRVTDTFSLNVGNHLQNYMVSAQKSTSYTL